MNGLFAFSYCWKQKCDEGAIFEILINGCINGKIKTDRNMNWMNWTPKLDSLLIVYYQFFAVLKKCNIFSKTFSFTLDII